jgi:hypothetical protein
MAPIRAGSIGVGSPRTIGIGANRARIHRNHFTLTAMRARLALFFALICFATTPLLGQADSARPPRANCFRPQPATACRAYFVFELSLMGRLAGTHQPHEGPTPPGAYRDLREYLAFDVGRMVNRADGYAIGGSLQAGGIENGGTRFALKARRRDWHAHGFSTDLAAGPLLAQQQSSFPNQGLVQGFGLTAETALGNRGLASVVLSGDAIHIEGRTASALHAGGRLESFPALGGAAVLAIGVVALIVVLSRVGFE